MMQPEYYELRTRAGACKFDSEAVARSTKPEHEKIVGIPLLLVRVRMVEEEIT